ncbi:MAG: ABC transporter permease [Chlorobiota bacterium]|nr:ABC transporter permease [Chlorobiota bacterium]QQS67624.1 MAG: ABC transporter permease [Chlorobiota bacterium]
MFLSKKNKSDTNNLITSETVNQNYSSLVKRQFKKNNPAVLAIYFIIVMFFLAIVADFLANNKPLICSYKGSIHSPVIEEYLVDIGIMKYSGDLVNADWKNLKYDWSFFPPIKYQASDIDLGNSFATPGSFESGHYLGTDQLGRDMLSGIIHGARISLTIGFISMSIAATIGIILGSLAGFFGGWVDIIISRIIELFLNFPSFFLIITIVAFLGANIFYVMIILGITGWMGIARLIRGEVLRVRGMEYITAAKSLGFKSSKIILKHVLPNSLAPVMVSVAFGIAGAILTESGLSFLGFGVPATVVTWGSMLNQSRSAPFAWWLAIFPGIMIFLTVISYNLIGDGLRDATDPRLKN